MLEQANSNPDFDAVGRLSILKMFDIYLPPRVGRLFLSAKGKSAKWVRVSVVKDIYKTNRGWSTRPSLDASGKPSCGPMGPALVDMELAASVDTLAEYYIRGWFSIYYTFKHLNQFICYNYPVFRWRYSTRHVDISPTKKTLLLSIFALTVSIVSLRWRSDATTRKLKYIPKQIIPTIVTISHVRLLS